jgi:hypothetical protein
MSPFQLGLVHTPVTPFTRERRIDHDRYAELIEFHIASGADALALPMHAGESVSLPDGERRTLLEFAIKQVNGRSSRMSARPAPALPPRWRSMPKPLAPPPSSPPRPTTGHRRRPWCWSTSSRSARR